MEGFFKCVLNTVRYANCHNIDGWRLEMFFFFQPPILCAHWKIYPQNEIVIIIAPDIW